MYTQKYSHAYTQKVTMALGPKHTHIYAHEHKYTHSSINTNNLHTHYSTCADVFTHSSTHGPCKVSPSLPALVL